MRIEKLKELIRRFSPSLAIALGVEGMLFCLTAGFNEPSIFWGGNLFLSSLALAIWGATVLMERKLDE
ncbi:MAG: hypothetical protein ACYS7Y_34565 [Planctomycetota bacterium]|jgi:hypothetical protein